MTAAGLPPEHLRDSKKARASKRRRNGEEVCDIASTTAGLEFSVTVPGLMVLLAVWAVDKRVSRYGGTRVNEAAASLLKGMLDMVLQGRTLHFPASSQCRRMRRVKGGVVETAADAERRGVDDAAAANRPAENPTAQREAAGRRCVALIGDVDGAVTRSKGNGTQS
ncbi:MAG: hypothetical protein GY772_28265 [bacterium]|nr:hypothetical protein [bacterium]